MEDKHVIRLDETIHPAVDTAATPEPDYEEGDLREVAPSREPGMRVNPRQVRRMPLADRGGRASPLRPMMAPRVPELPPQPVPVPLPQLVPVPWPATSVLGVWAGVLALCASAMLGGALITPLFQGERTITLFGASSGQGNAYIILALTMVAVCGGALLLASRSSARLSFIGGLMCLSTGILATGMTLYLVTLMSHRELIARGYDYGLAMWLLLGGFACALIAGILGMVRGTRVGDRRAYA